MRWIGRFWRWIGRRFKDLFYNIGNRNLELGRVLAGLFAGLVTFAVYWNSIHLGLEIDINGLLVGLAALSTALGLGIAAKDYIREKFQRKAKDAAE